MEQIGILHHPRIPQSVPLAYEIGQWLSEQGVKTWVGSTWDETGINHRLDKMGLLVVLGGDGSLLRAARLSVSWETPIFGVNLGRVGFLSEAQADDWQERLTQVLNDNFWVEERLMLHAALWRDGYQVDTFTALNDIVVGRGQQARVVRFTLRVDDDLVTHYTADALIVATPTGSTAYAMAAGGPLLPPRLQNFVVLPVAPHLSFNRALVLHETAEIKIEVSMDHEAYITPDGQHGISLQDGDAVIIHKNEHLIPFARVDSPGYFYRRLMGRLGYVR
ncbi:MAG: NAD(+)/NADH kinase [Anaerolineales bacterium]|nr:NAD(+)/NADH kinase [Anaerolineales bacterium]MCA9929042.1 NAD(+)/NADH kinase [Anaerolineales bacterium]